MTPLARTYPSAAVLQIVLLEESRSQVRQPVGQIIETPVFETLRVFVEGGEVHTPDFFRNPVLQVMQPEESQDKQLLGQAMQAVPLG
jgi:hypothetical protein